MHLQSVWYAFDEHCVCVVHLLTNSAVVINFKDLYLLEHKALSVTILFGRSFIRNMCSTKETTTHTFSCKIKLNTSNVLIFNHIFVKYFYFIQRWQVQCDATQFELCTHDQYYNNVIIHSDKQSNKRQNAINAMQFKYVFAWI